MSLIVAFLNADYVAGSRKDMWSNIAGQTRVMPTKTPSPFRPSARGRVTQLFGSNATGEARS
jgi:hypothetical protein